MNRPTCYALRAKKFSTGLKTFECLGHLDAFSTTASLSRELLMSLNRLRAVAVVFALIWTANSVLAQEAVEKSPATDETASEATPKPSKTDETSKKPAKSLEETMRPE